MGQLLEGKPFTRDDDATLLAMYGAGKTYISIARALDRRPISVRRRHKQILKADQARLEAQREHPESNGTRIICDSALAVLGAPVSVPDDIDRRAPCRVLRWGI